MFTAYSSNKNRVHILKKPLNLFKTLFEGSNSRKAILDFNFVYPTYRLKLKGRTLN